ncbi:MAG: branched-chain amino acid transaminase [Candidatus Marsarchaeota archaeon]|nr:branched-chain amino acid transaminase [Candidatus Marsarchaeota archaeon]
MPAAKIKKGASQDRRKLKVWLDGKLVNYNDATVPILTHSLQYGSGIFEGIRAYETSKGTAVFRLEEHIERLINTAKIYEMDLGYTKSQLIKAVLDTIKANKLKSCYIRPFAFYNTDLVGVSSFGKPISVFIGAIPFGAYFGEGKEKGIRCKISSWRRINSEILPVKAKASGNYLNSIIANTEARRAGYDEAILLSINGMVAEGSGENIFLVKDNVIVTPDDSADILIGVTRNSIAELAEELDMIVQEREVHKEELYTADEVFFTGTAAEVTPIVNVDGVKIGSGKPGPVTRLLQNRFTEIVNGKDKRFGKWLTIV